MLFLNHDEILKSLRQTDTAIVHIVSYVSKIPMNGQSGILKNFECIGKIGLSRILCKCIFSKDDNTA